jgi:hypothetical protein
MSARDEAVEMIRRICPPHLSADEYGRILAEKFDAHRAEALREAADKLTLELAPEQPGAGPGFLLALRLAVRAMRRMADEAAAS